MQDFKIRKAEPEDYESLCDLYNELDVHHIQLRPDIFKAFAGPARERLEILEILRVPESSIFVACKDGKIIGLAAIEVRYSPEYPMFIEQKYLLIDNVVILEKYRGNGIAKALFEKVKQSAIEWGLNTIKLKVYSGNKSALDFYKSQGFTPVTEELELKI